MVLVAMALSAACGDERPTARLRRASREESRRLRTPYCEGPAIDPGLGFFAPHLPASDLAGAPVAESQSKFTAKDVVLVRQTELRSSSQEQDANENVMGPPVEKVQPAVSIELAPADLDAFARWTGDLARENGRVVIKTGKTTFVTARVGRSIHGKMVVTGSIGSICKKTSRRTLPSDLAPGPAH